MPPALKSTFASHPKLFFFKRPIKWIRVAFYENPAYSWTIGGIGIAYGLMIFTPGILYALGIKRQYQPLAPVGLPQPVGPRKIMDPKYDDPLPSGALA